MLCQPCSHTDAFITGLHLKPQAASAEKAYCVVAEFQDQTAVPIIEAPYFSCSLSTRSCTELHLVCDTTLHQTRPAADVVCTCVLRLVICITYQYFNNLQLGHLVDTATAKMRSFLSCIKGAPQQVGKKSLEGLVMEKGADLLQHQYHAACCELRKQSVKALPCCPC